MRIKLQQQQSWHPSGDHRLNKWLVVDSERVTAATRGNIIGPKALRALEDNPDIEIEYMPLEDLY